MSHRKENHERIRDIAPVGLRLPSDLKVRIRAAAKENGRSINAEIVARLKMSFLVDEGRSHSAFIVGVLKALDIGGLIDLDDVARRHPGISDMIETAAALPVPPDEGTD